MKFNKELFERAVSDYSAKTPFSGVIRVTYKEKIIYENTWGYADFEKKIPHSRETLYTLYSLSKPFCAIGLLILVEKGLVSLDAHPGEYVPEARGFDSRVTVRHLLNHTSGLPDFEQLKEFKEKHKNPRLEELRRDTEELTGYPMFFAPGTDKLYANINFILAALIIENVSGIGYAEYMAREVFTPLGMETAVVESVDMHLENSAMGYALDESNNLIPVGKSYDYLLGAGDIVARADDVYKLNHAIKNKMLLSERMWDEVLTPSPLNSMGYGCTVSEWHGKHRITHNGGHTGFRTLHIQLPDDDFDIILLSNCGFGDARIVLANAIHEATYGFSENNNPEIEMDKGYI